MLCRLWRTLLRFAFYLFYNPFAFTYDTVSWLVSRGHWRAWTRVALRYVTGTRVLDLPCGTGNLLLDLRAAGYGALGVDLSATMLDITRAKFERLEARAPILRARAQALPFADRAFDAITLTFPPGFVREPRVWVELARVLKDEGRLIWVDAARLLGRDLWSRLCARALVGVGGDERAFQNFARAMLADAAWDMRVHVVPSDSSVVTVVCATKKRIV